MQTAGDELVTQLLLHKTIHVKTSKRYPDTPKLSTTNINCILLIFVN